MSSEGVEKEKCEIGGDCQVEEEGCGNNDLILYSFVNGGGNWFLHYWVTCILT